MDTQNIIFIALNYYLAQGWWFRLLLLMSAHYMYYRVQVYLLYVQVSIFLIFLN